MLKLSIYLEEPGEDPYKLKLNHRRVKVTTWMRLARVNFSVAEYDNEGRLVRSCQETFAR